MHADGTVRLIATEVLRRILRAFPARRNEVVIGMAAFASKIPDEFPEVWHFFSAMEGGGRREQVWPRTGTRGFKIDT